MTSRPVVPSVGTMTTWTPGNGGPEVLSLGDLRAPRLSTTQVVARLLLCLGIGVLLVGHFLGGTTGARAPRAAGAAGSVGSVGSAGTAASAGTGRAVAAADCALGRPDHERADCPRGRPALASDLTGSWLRTGVTGVWRGLEGRELIRFDADGGFTWGLVGPYRTVRGRYLLSGGTVRVTAMRRSLCHPGDTYAWQATVSRAGRLHLAHVPGSERDGCTVSPEMWTGRRLRAADPVPASSRR